MKNVILIKFGEIGLKGKNRYIFESILMENIRLATHVSRQNLKMERGRIYFYYDEQPSLNYREILRHICGIVGFSFAKEAPNNNSVPELAELAINTLKSLDLSSVHSFKVDARRAAKTFPIDSMQINQEIGGAILQAFPHWKVDVHHPDLHVHIEVRPEGMFIYTNLDSEVGPGGLPVGVGGRGLLLLSGGIDSPVAGWSLLKRGMMIDAVHFHSFPYTGEKAKEKALDLARILTQWKLRHINLFIPFFTHVQETVNKLCPEPTWTLIHRRFMLRIAEKIALQGTDHNFKPYHCIITGDNLGQVASQTIQNIGVVSLATKLPVLRPLIAYDKQEIITKAREIDTLRISTQPHLDCCTIFAPKVPLTKALESEIVQAESALPIEELVRESLDKMEIIKIPYK